MPDALSQIDAAKAALLVIDLQDKLLPAMHESHAVVSTACKLIQAMRVLNVPCIVTEQYPQGLGPTCSQVRELIGEAKPFDKMLFSACVPEVMAAIEQAGRTQIIIAGIEAHVCVHQTVMDLLRARLNVFVCADAVSSRRPLDRNVALDRMRQAGAVATTAESAIFELLQQAGGDVFKQILKIVK